MNRKILFFLIGLLVLAGLFFLNESPQSKTNNLSMVEDHQHSHDHDSHEESAASGNIVSSAAPLSNQASPQKFDMDLKKINDIKNRVDQWFLQWPQSKPQLMSFIQERDPFKQEGQKPSPHTLGEIAQNKLGALKVLALRKMLAQESESAGRLGILQTIANQASDPTMVNIARSALDSEKKGRDFFEDFSDGVSRLPLDTEDEPSEE